MAFGDLTAVKEIDRLAFPSPARAGLFEHELEQNQLAHYQVVGLGADGRFRLVGFAGYWLIADEVHISTIATHPERRGQGLGELLLLNLLLLAYTHPANLVTLEVRQNNLPAQSLYKKYQFEHTGTRRRYYRDTGEDALIMTVAALDASYRHFLQRQEAALFTRLSSEPPGS
jgi:ribosomal-protein-alanine N-acetyltransferase